MEGTTGSAANIGMTRSLLSQIALAYNDREVKSGKSCGARSEK